MRTDPNDPEAWFDFARRDLARAELFLREHDSVACVFYLQQAAEKFLKGRLIGAGWRLRKTHHLNALLREAERFDLHELLRPERAEALTAEYIIGQAPTKTRRAEPPPAQVQGWMNEVSVMVFAIATT